MFVNASSRLLAQRNFSSDRYSISKAYHLLVISLASYWIIDATYISRLTSSNHIAFLNVNFNILSIEYCFSFHINRIFRQASRIMSDESRYKLRFHVRTDFLRWSRYIFNIVIFGNEILNHQILKKLTYNAFADYCNFPNLFFINFLCIF